MAQHNHPHPPSLTPLAAPGPPPSALPQHYGVRKAAGYEEPLANKEPLLLVNGLRAWHARPVYSTDEHGADKHKMERFLHEGRCAAAGGVLGVLGGPLH